ncbi:MAG: hypothetical protein RL328_468 [Acidobacteriota bacterium]|jgi:hypothetical protein
MMRERYGVVLGWAAAGAAAALFAAATMIAQTPAGAGKAKTAPAKSTAKGKAAAKGATPRTAWGDPDLQGTWFVTEDVPLERTAANVSKEFLTDAEIAESDSRKGIAPGRNSRTEGADDVSGAYNAVFNSVLKTGRRTSRIIDTPDGRIPPLVTAPQARGGRGAGAPAGGGGLGLGTALEQVSNPETVAQSSRCLGVSMPFLPLNTLFAQGTVMQIVQSPKTVAIYMEDDHAGGSNRIIHMDGKHPPANVKYYLGDSRGHWEGNTLVVDTANYSVGFRNSNIETYKTVERFTRTSTNDLRREITFIDPQTWTKPWTVLIDMGKTSDDQHMIFDSACHEGNHGMVGILVGARRQEAAAKQGK